MTDLFKANLDIVFFVYGLAFLVMGIAIIVQPRQGTLFKIGTILWFLGAFGIAHGFNELLDMWAIIRKNPQAVIIGLDVLRWAALIISYYFLFEFGRRLLKISLKNRAKTSYLAPWLGIALVFLVILLGFRDENFWHHSSIWARYLLGFPSSFLTALGFIFYYRAELKENMPGLQKDFYYPAAFFFLYGILGGLVVPPAKFFPASVINTESFIKFSGGIPVQVFRALVALFSTVFIGRILTIFKWEAVKNLSRVQTERFTDKVTASVQEMIMVIDKNFRIKWANARLKTAYGNDVLGGFCYKITHRIDTPCHPPNDICPVSEVIKTNKPVAVVHTHFNTEGSPVYAEVSAYPMLDEKGRPTGDFVHISRNVTQQIKERKELEDAYTELKAIQEKLLATEKLASLGKLSAGIAHEINNPIGFVVSNLSTLEKYISNLLHLINIYSDSEVVLPKENHEETAKAAKQIEEVKKAIDIKYILEDLPKLIKETFDGAQRVVRIVSDLKSFARKDELEFSEANINDLVVSALNIVWNEVKYKTDVVKEFSDFPKVECHPQQITQALMNIIVNAAQSIEKKGTITIKTYARDGKAYVEITDTGSGMTNEVRGKIFEPFFTTKKVGEGTGLGLAIVYGIIQNHNGNIEVKSKVGAGSTFIISLPIKAVKNKRNKPAYG